MVAREEQEQVVCFPLTLAIPADVLPYLRLLRAGNGILTRLDLEHTAAEVVAAAVLAQGVHASLKLIILPPKKIVSMLAVAGADGR